MIQHLSFSVVHNGLVSPRRLKLTTAALSDSDTHRPSGQVSLSPIFLQQPCQHHVTSYVMHRCHVTLTPAGVKLTLSGLIDGKNVNGGGHKVGLGFELEA